MARVALLYGTTEGQTATVAERIADVLADAGHEPTLFHAGHLPEGFSLTDYDAAVVGASIHGGKHQQYVRRFVREHVDELNAMPSAFFSVSLTAAEGSDEAWETARGMLAEFLEETGWDPDATAVVPGALKYSEYGVLKRFLMKRIAKQAGGDTDTSRDYEYTDWDEVEGFASDFGDALG
jgi:menaquinone-dependent protoporphyrinogen oxidase